MRNGSVPIYFQAARPEKFSNHLETSRMTQVALWTLTLGGYYFLRKKAAKRILPYLSASVKEKQEMECVRNDFLNRYPNRAERLHMMTFDGSVIDGIQFRCQTRAQRLQDEKWVIYFNGMGETYENRLETPLLQEYADLIQANVLLFNYRGIMESVGFPLSSRDIVVDGEACVQYLLHLGIKEENILLHGFSLGAGVAAEVSFLHKKCSVLNDCSFDILSHVPGKFAGFLIRCLKWELNSVKNWDSIQGNKGIIYHKNDFAIPYHLSSFYKGLKEKIKEANPDNAYTVNYWKNTEKQKLRLKEAEKPKNVIKLTYAPYICERYQKKIGVDTHAPLYRNGNNEINNLIYFTRQLLNEPPCISENSHVNSCRF